MLKTKIIYTDVLPSKEAIAELLTLNPLLVIEWEKYTGAIKVDYNPYMKNTNLSWAWLRTLYKPETDVKCFLTTVKVLQEKGIKDHLGLYNLDPDSKHDFYITNPAKLDKRAKANGFKTNFAWIFTHEFLHGANFLRYKDHRRAAEEVHQWEKDGELKARLAEHLEYYRSLQVEAVGLLQKIVALLQAQLKPGVKLVNPIPPYPVTQTYGNYNPSLYPLTGVHLGLDNASPLGTRIVAPADGEVTYSGYTKTIGYYFTYRYSPNRYLVALHLQKAPAIGRYKAGDTLGLVGKTGLITGVHSHLEVWTENIDRARVAEYVNKDTWKLKTRDPLKEF